MRPRADDRKERLRSTLQARPSAVNLRHHLVALGCSLLLLAAVPSRGEIIFIDADSLKPTNQVPRYPPPGGSLELHLAVLRFVPTAKAADWQKQLGAASSLAQVIDGLGRQGQVNLLYLGDRDSDWTTNTLAFFQAQDARPAFSLDEEVNDTLTNRQFGLTLRVQARPAAAQQVELEWEGNFSWSPDLIDRWAGDKYLLFGMRLAKLLKPGMVYEEGDAGDEDSNSTGVNLRTLFRKKKPAEKKPETVKAHEALSGNSFILAEREEVPLRGQQTLANQRLAIQTVPVSASAEDSEVIVLVLRPAWRD